MIITLILFIFYQFVILILAILPTSNGISSTFQTSLTNVINYAQSFNFIFPINTLIQLLILTATFQAGILLFKLLNWSINKIRGSGT